MQLIEFSVQNFRSIKEKETFSLQAESSKSKADNVFEASIQKKENTTDSIRLLKTAVIYGANASGKSNFIRAMAALRWLVVHSADLKVGAAIQAYEPFKLDVSTVEQPVIFSIVFMIETIKYEYTIGFTKNVIVEETLDFYPSGKGANLFKREPDISKDYTTVKIGKLLKPRDIPKSIFNNQAYLSKFGSDIPHPQLTEVYKYFSNLEIWNALDKFDVSKLCKDIATNIADSKNEHLRKRLSQLIKVADTRIEEVKAIQIDEMQFQFPEGFPKEIRNRIITQNSLRTVAIHNRYDGNQYKDQVEFDLLEEESQGTQVLFALGGIILEVLDEGGILFFDELDNSLHPNLCKFLIRLFNNSVMNPKGAQLVFATHEVTLLDKTIFRKDQIWFTQKNKLGATILYSTKDIEGVREDTNFEAHYRAGKFGGRPKIKELQFIFADNA
jgi:AAA15 family ATPase/GTPase